MAEWRETPRYPRYRVSDDGEVMGRSGCVLKQHINYHGYMHVTLNRPGLRSYVVVHVLVCKAFHGPKPTPKHQAAHWDGDKLNNHVDNLRWATALKNAADMQRHGTVAMGERNGRAKLAAQDVRDIRAMYAEGRWTQAELADIYDVSQRHISAIVRGQYWRGVA